ncbi:MAG: histidine--tRNA ligase [Spirochaetia bacterium]|nr:histidine--tRNA ligase [Spirochaetota bacterium]MCX8096338.1 histidine--tRNA ligase [Spirochaetota bacterium]MDW8112301.1 histidine--tRNA ligase [Spirochaetia bacterium]
MDERFSRLRGFLDIFGEDLTYFELIESVFRKYSVLYGFNELKTPILERTELFVRGIGEGSDIVRKEMFSFEDRGGRSVTLRPEGTASVVRALLENNLINEPRFQKVFYVGPMFRAERPQAGRLRQFHQVGVEWFGVDDPIIDVEVVSLVFDILFELGLVERSELVINSVGCDVCSPNYKRELEIFFDTHYNEFCDDCKQRREKNILRVFDCKNEKCQTLLKEATKITSSICDVCRFHLDTLERYVSRLGIRYRIDESLVRGLDYYTRNVFEVRYQGIGSQNAIAGGGRYNGLVSEFGGPNVPAFGFAMGIERTMLALKEVRKPNYSKTVAVCTISGNEVEYAFKVVKILRSNGLISNLLSYLGSISKQFKFANRLGAKLVVVIGENEVKENKVSIKDMDTGEQTSVSLDGLVNYIITNISS